VYRFRLGAEDLGVSHGSTGGGSQAQVVAGCGFLGLTAGMVEIRAGSIAGVEVRLARQHFPVGRLRKAPMARLAAR
jgi:hypothetical protein